MRRYFHTFVAQIDQNASFTPVLVYGGLLLP